MNRGRGLSSGLPPDHLGGSRFNARHRACFPGRHRGRPARRPPRPSRARGRAAGPDRGAGRHAARRPAGARSSRAPPRRRRRPARALSRHGATPGGSSHGSAAGVAAGFFPLALGTQTIGSIIRPAAFCGVAGFVPTYGCIPADGTLHVSRSLDRVGPFAGDAAGILLAAAALISRWHPVGGAPRPVLGVADGPFLEAAEPAARELFERQVDILAAAGYQVRGELVFPDAEEVAQSLRRLMNGEFAREHAALFERYQDRYRPQTAGGIEQGISASGSPWPNRPWSYVRLPAVAIPAGAIGELPVGLQLVGGWHADEELLEWAVALGRDLGFPTLPAPAHQPRPQSFTWW